jgi:hypothetical protein
MMTRKTIDINALVSRFDALVQRAQRLAYPVRDRKEQQALAAELLNIRDDLRVAKRGAIQMKRDVVANHLLAFQCLAHAYAEELHVWIHLHEKNAHAAWAALVSAQEHVAVALRAMDADDRVVNYARKLDQLEQLAFPRLVFFSGGFEHSGGRCSICGASFEDCPHREGKVYCGQVCAEVDFSSMRIDHVSFVESPRDKRCYAFAIQDEDGTWRDIMTLAPTEDEKKDTVDTSGVERGRQIKGVVFNNELPPGVEP